LADAIAVRGSVSRFRAAGSTISPPFAAATWAVVLYLDRPVVRPIPSAAVVGGVVEMVS
jgi:hypothetical protein